MTEDEKNLERRRRNDELFDRVFEKLDKIGDIQIAQSKDLERINRTLYVNNGETCLCTKMDDLTKSLDELKTRRLVTVSTAQAIWTIIFGFLSVAGTVTAIMLTVKQLRG
jgi:hypothetical protein